MRRVYQTLEDSRVRPGPLRNIDEIEGSDGRALGVLGA